MTDIVERLRMEMRGDRHADLAREAADEIERLLHEVAQMTTARAVMEAEIERLRAALDGERERCATVALEQRCERGTPWDLACTTIAAAIRGEVR